MRIVGRRPQRGFTIIEVLVSMVVIAVSLLGLAHMQLAGLRFAQDSTYRTQATLLAIDMYQRIIANQAASGVSGATEAYVNASDTVAANTAVDTPLDCLNTQCSAADLADYDVAVWRWMISERIPSGTGTIASGDGLSYQITVEWWDRGVEGDELVQEEVDMTIPTAVP